MTKHLVGVMQENRRIAKRFPSSLVVLLMWEGRLIQANAEDISMTGMRLASEIDLEAGTDLRAHFAPRNESETYELAGRIVWSQPSTEIAGLYLAGYEFGHLSDRVVGKLAKLIRQAGGESGADDLPLVDAEAVASVPTPGASKIKTDEIVFTPVNEAEVQRSRLAITPRPGEEPWSVAQQLKHAIAQDTERRAADRQRAEALLQRGRSAQSVGQHDAAIAAFREVIQLLPDSAECHEELAAALYLKGEAREAARMFDRALRIRMERE